MILLFLFTFPGDHVSLRPLPLLSMLPPDLNNYYRYHGSMTTPPCTQTVSWTVFKDYLEVGHRQVEDNLKKMHYLPLKGPF